MIDIDSTETAVPPQTEDYWKYYSVIDLNNDGINDLIYSGPCNPYIQTGIFINDGKRLQLVYDYPGRIISLEKIGGRTIIASLKEAIGCDSENSLTEIIFEKNSQPIINRISYATLPEITFENLKTVKVKGVLRRSPEQNDLDEKEECSERIIKGNHLLQIEKETEVIQLTQQENWLLILYNRNGNESIIGWIKE